MNINTYIKTFGNKSFKELPFNEVDGLIFAEMAYINFQLYISPTQLIKLKDLEIKDRKAFYTGSVDYRQNETMINLMRASHRYKDIKVGYCEYCNDDVNYQQFFAFTIVLPNHDLYLSFRGTDTSLLGWKEDFKIAYQDMFPSQLMALSYTNKILEKHPNNFYLGGHSKGGNLAIYAALYMDEVYRPRMIKATSYDGPGFRQDITKLDSFNELHDRFEKFITFNDVIGVVYNKIKETKIVYSNGILLGGHDPFTWKVNNKGLFALSKNRSQASKRSEEALMNWLTQLTDKQKELAIKVLFDYLGESKTIYDLLLNGARIIANGKKQLKKYKKEEVDEAKNIFRQLGRFYLSAYSPRRLVKKNNK